MRAVGKWFWLLCLAVGGFLPLQAAEPQAHASRVIARLKDKPPTGLSLQQLAARNQLQVRKSLDRSGRLYLMDFSQAPAPGPSTISPLTAAFKARIDTLRRSADFEFVEPDYVIKSSEVSTDSRYVDGTLWGLNNVGQNSGIPGVDIAASAAWGITTGSTNVIVAVVDTGIRYSHQDLAAQMWRNRGEIAGNGLDDDHDGYVDDVFGINTVDGNGNPMDDNGHGTHVAGIIGAAANDGHPIVGVTWHVQLMACRFMDSTGSGFTSDAITCIDFAVAHGARVINASWGGPGYSRSLSDSIARANLAGVLFVAAAGNDGVDTDVSPDYPSSYPLDNIISVAAIDRRGNLASFSNFGAQTVDIAAPGVSILSSTQGSDVEYQTYSGTSMATPYVAGVAALVLAKQPTLTVSALKSRILSTAVPMASLSGKMTSGGRVNAAQALGGGLLTSNTPPVIAGPVDQIISEDSKATAPFTVSDAETAASLLAVSARSSNEAVAPQSGISFAGSGSQRTITVIPSANATGSAVITVSVSDGTDATESSFRVTVSPVNDSPAITTVPDQEHGAVPFGINFQLNDPDNNPDSLQLAASSGNRDLLADSGLSISGTGGSRVLNVSPEPGKTGISKIGISVTDSSGASSRVEFSLGLLFVPEVRSYRGLVYDPATVSAGRSGTIRMSTTRAGKFSGLMTVGGRRLLLSGQLDRWGHGRQTWNVAGQPPLELDFFLSEVSGVSTVSTLLRPDPDAEIWGAFKSGSDTIPILGEADDYTTSTGCPYAGRWNAVLAPDPAGSSFQAGCSYVGLNVSGGGGVLVSGMFIDGRRFRFRSEVSREGRVPLFWNSAGKSFLLGWIDLPADATAALNGTAAIDLAEVGTGYRENVTATGSALKPSKTGVELVSPLGALELQFENASLNFSVPLEASGPSNYKTQDGLGRLVLNPRTGEYRGWYDHPDAGRLLVQGLFLPVQQQGPGFFKGETGQGVLLLRAAEPTAQ